MSIRQNNRNGMNNDTKGNGTTNGTGTDDGTTKNMKNSQTSHDIDHDAASDALNSLMACSLASTSIRKAYLKICEIADTPIILTKKDLMDGIVRDFRICKVERVHEEVQSLDPDDPKFNKNGFAVRSHYPGPYVRQYQNNAMVDLKKKMHPKLWTFDLCRVIDLSGQLIGDKGIDELCIHLSHSPVETLALNANNITDKGLIALSLNLRSLSHLETLHLADNKFRDEGIEAMFHGDRYSASLRLLNLSENNLSNRSAWAIGMMFYPSRICALESLLIGGQCNIRYSIDKFLCALVPHLILPGNRCLKKLNIAQAGVTDVGIVAIMTLLMAKPDPADVVAKGMHSDVLRGGGIEYLVMSRSPIFRSRHRHSFLHTLIANKSLTVLEIKECGFRVHEMNEIQNYIRERHHAASTEALISSVQSLTLFSTLGATKYTNDHRRIRKKLSLPWAAFDKGHCQWRHMRWTDKLSFSRLVVMGRTNLEQLRANEERYISEVRFAPPAIPRQTLPSRSKAAMYGSGVTKVKKFSDKVKDHNSTDEGKLAFLAKGEHITKKYHIPENLSAIFITALKEEEIKNTTEAKVKAQKDFFFMEETADMSDNDTIRLRKQREVEEEELSYVTMNPLELASSKNMEELPESVYVIIKHALRNKASVEDLKLHIREVSCAARCGLLKHMEYYFHSSSANNTSRMQNDDQSMTSALTLDVDLNRNEKENECVDRNAVADQDADADKIVVPKSSQPSSPFSNCNEKLCNLESRCGTETANVNAECHHVDPVVATIKTLALQTVSDNLQYSIENIIKTLVSIDPDEDSPRFLGDHGSDDETIALTTKSDGKRISVSSRRSILNSARSNLTVENEVLDRIKLCAGNLAAAITTNILTAAVSKPFAGSDQNATCYDENAAVSMIARTITPSIIAAAVDAACLARLGITSDGIGVDDDDVDEVSRVLIETITSTIAGDGISVFNSSPKNDSFRSRNDSPNHAFQCQNVDNDHERNERANEMGDALNTIDSIQDEICPDDLKLGGSLENCKVLEYENENESVVPLVELTKNELYDDIFRNVARGLRAFRDNDRFTGTEMTLFEYLKYLSMARQNLERRVDIRQNEVMLMYSKWNQDLASRHDAEASDTLSGTKENSSVGGTNSLGGTTRMSLQQRDAWLAQLKVDRENQKAIDEASRDHFFVEAEMALEDYIASQSELSVLLEELLGVMVCMEMSYEDMVVGSDRFELLASDDFVSNSRTLSAHIMELDVPLCYASYCHHRSDLIERVKNGTSIARLESASASQVKEPKKNKEFNPRKGIRFRIFADVEAKRSAEKHNEVITKGEQYKDEANDPESSDSMRRIETDDVKVDTIDDSFQNVEDTDVTDIPLHALAMYTPPGTSHSTGSARADTFQYEIDSGHPQTNLHNESETDNSADDFPSPMSIHERTDDDSVQSSPNKKKKRRKDKLIDIEAEAPITPEERKAAAREKKKQRNAKREMERLRSQMSSMSHDDFDYDDESPDSRRLHTSPSFTYSECDEYDVNGSRDDAEQPVRRRRKKKVKKPIEVVEEVQSLEPETLAQRRVRKRAEAKALKLSEDEKCRALLPPIVVVKPQEESPQLTKAQKRRERKLARRMAAADEEAQWMAQDEGDGINLDSVSSPGPSLSRANSFQSFRNLFSNKDNDESTPIKDVKINDEPKIRKQKSAKLKKVELPSLEVLGMYVPPSSDGTLRVCLQFLSCFGAVPGPGFFVTGFQPDCNAKGLLKEGDKVNEICGQSLKGLTLDEVKELMDRDKSPKRGYTLLNISRVAVRPPRMLPNGGVEQPVLVGVTQEMIDDKIAEIGRAYEAKKKIKKSIRSWTKEFERQENRIVSEEDKLTAPHIFVPLKQLFSYIFELEDLLDKLKIAFERDKNEASEEKL